MAQMSPADGFKKAKKAFSKYQVESDNEKKMAYMKDAVSGIEAATADMSGFTGKKTSQVYQLEGDIYNQIALNDALMMQADPTHKPTMVGAEVKGADAYFNAFEKADKGYQKKDALAGLQNAYGTLNSLGYYYVQNKDYLSAYKAFTKILDADKLLKENKKDLFKGSQDPEGDYNNLLYMAGISGMAYQPDESAKGAMSDDVKANSVALFEELRSKKYEEAGIYDRLFQHYNAAGDADKAVGILEEGRALFPDDEGLRVAEINYYLQAGKLDELVGKLKAAISATPENSSLYSVLGQVFDDLNAREREAGNADKANEYFDEALSYYNQALEKDGKNYRALFNIGAAYYNRAAEVSIQMKELENDYSKEGTRKYEALQGTLNEWFDKALPFFKRAEAIEAGDISVLIALKEIYAKKNDIETSQEFKKRLDKVQAGEKLEGSYFKDN